MSGSNPFAFTGPNVPQLTSSSEASLRAELARSKQNVMMLQREVQTQKDANGVAHALVSAKNQIQEAQRESKRAQLAERVAREALASFNNMRKYEEKARKMSQDPDILQEELERLRNELAGTRERYRDNLAQDEVSFAAELEKAETANQKQQEQLHDFRDRLAKADAEVRQLKKKAGEDEKELRELSKAQLKVKKALEEREQVVAELHNINDNLVADLVQKEAERKALARECDHFELKLTETLLALKEREESEAETRTELELYRAEAEQVTHGLSEQMESLQADIDTFDEQVKENERTVATQNDHIKSLERENEVLNDKLQEMDTHRASSDYVVRPLTNRNVSGFSQSSIADELGLLLNAEFEDYESGYAHSDAEPVEISIDLELSGVRDIISIAPRNAPTSKMSVCISNAASTAPKPQHHNSFPMGYSPVSSVYSIEPAQPTAPRLSMYDDTIICFSPSEPTAPKLSLDIVEGFSPIEPRLPWLTYSDIYEALDYGPLEPTVSTSAPAPKPQRFSSHFDESLNYSPVEPTFQTLHAESEAQILSPHVIEHASFSLEPIDSHYVETPSSCKGSPSLLNSLERQDSIITYEPSNTFRFRRTHLEPFAKLHNHSDTNSPDDLQKIWPLGDETQDELPPSQGSPPSNLPVPCATAPTKGFPPFTYCLLYAIFLLVCVYCWRLRSKLHAWEFANGTGFGEGHGNVHDRYGSPYGNGHYLLGKLPHNLLSADSFLPEKAVNIITNTVSAVEDYFGLGPTSLF